MRESDGQDAPALGRYLVLYGSLYGAYGSLSPFLPNFLDQRGLSAQQIALLLAAATLTRLVAGPLAGRLADRHDAARPVLAVAATLSGLAAFAHLAGFGFLPLLLLGLGYAVATAPLAPLADALALAVSAKWRGFAYGWVRGAGSVAFILATSTVGWLVPVYGLTVAVAAGGALFLGAALAATLVPVQPAASPKAGRDGLWQGFRTVFAIPRFRRVVIVAALVIGAHAMHDAFAMILWRGAGIPPGIAGLLWSESVAAEVAVFLVAGPWLLARIGPARAAALAAGAGALRWGVMAETAALPVLAATQLLHGATFALVHLACLRLIADAVPARLGATALTLYGTFGLGLASALLTLASGALYDSVGARGFWAMALISLGAVPLALALRTEAGEARA